MYNYSVVHIIWIIKKYEFHLNWIFLLLEKLKFIRGLIEHTDSHTIHTQCIYVQKILHQPPSVGLTQARPNNLSIIIVIIFITVKYCHNYFLVCTCNHSCAEGSTLGVHVIVLLLTSNNHFLSSYYYFRLILVVRLLC